MDSRPPVFVEIPRCGMRHNAGMITASHLLTAEELFRMSEEETRWCELIEGEILPISPPGFAHGIVSQSVSLLLLEFVDHQQIGLVVIAKAGFLVGRDPDTVMAPDGAFVRQERIDAIGLHLGYFPEAPAMAFEVISPTIVLVKLAARCVAGSKAALSSLGSSTPRREPSRSTRLSTTFTSLRIKTR